MKCQCLKQSLFKRQLKQLLFSAWKKPIVLVCRILSFILSILLSLTLTACYKALPANESSKQTELVGIKLLATAFPAYDLAYTLLYTQVTDAGNLKVNCQPNLPFNIELKLLTPPGTDPHTFEPSVRTAYDMEQADMILCVGLDIDQQYDKLLTNLSESSRSKLHIFSMCKQVKLLDNEETTFDVQTALNKLDDANEQVTFNNQSNLANKDPHIWLSPKRQITLLTNFSKELKNLVSKKYPKHKATLDAFLHRQLKDLNKLWQKLDQAYTSTFKTATLKDLLFADRFPLRYLCHDYGLKGYAAFNGCNHQLDPNLQTLTNLHDLANKLDCPVIFYTEFGQAKLAKVISGDKRQVALFRTGHTVSQAELKAGYTIYALQKANLTLLELATHKDSKELHMKTKNMRKENSK